MQKYMIKVGVSCLMIATMLIGMIAAPGISAAPILGDFDGNGALTTMDARKLLIGIVSQTALSEEELLVGDMNSDGKVNTTDARKILQVIVNNSDKLPQDVSSSVPLSGIEDVTDSSGVLTYTMYAEYTDTYTFTCAEAESLRVKTSASTAVGGTSLTVDLEENTVCEITVCGEANTLIDLEVTAAEHEKRLPYKPNITIDPDSLDTVGDASVNPLTAMEISYTQREGGTYIYANNPEKLQAADIGQAILRTKDLSGDVQFTWEHSNFTGRPIYLGYQLKNTGDTDVYVTVTNIGMQVSGEWLGQRSWSDYYNYSFDLPSDYYDASGNVASKYQGQDFIDYTPRVFQPTTYRIPAGEYIYVLGGTTSDAYNGVNVANTANQRIAVNACSNAVVKFLVSGGTVTGTFYCYTDTAQVKAEPAEQGYVVERDGTQFGSQYKGVAYHQGLVESEQIWYVNDQTKAQDLPVTYQSEYDPSASQNTEPYAPYTNTTRNWRKKAWMTHGNTQQSNYCVGSDMIDFQCVTTDGQLVTIGSQCADGTGAPANTGNWMVDYHDNMTFVNQGDTTRYFTINKNANGALMALVLDNSGEVLAAKCTIRPISEDATAANYELYTVEVPPHSVKQVTVSYVLTGNSYGQVRHWVTLK